MAERDPLEAGVPELPGVGRAGVVMDGEGTENLPLQSDIAQIALLRGVEPEQPLLGRPLRVGEPQRLLGSVPRWKAMRARAAAGQIVLGELQYALALGGKAAGDSVGAVVVGVAALESRSPDLVG